MITASNAASRIAPLRASLSRTACWARQRSSKTPICEPSASSVASVSGPGSGALNASVRPPAGNATTPSEAIAFSIGSSRTSPPRQPSEIPIAVSSAG